MLRALGLTRSESVSPSEATNLILKQAHDFELALQAMDYLLDDRTDEGLHLINDDPDSTIKVLANGVIKFLEFTLGFEPEVMKQAGLILGKAESLSHRDRAKYQKMKLKTSSIFPPGTEYAIAYAEANLLNALVMLLSESMIESAKALYKLRKAYHILNELLAIINEHKEDIEKLGLPKVSTNDSSSSLQSNSSFADLPGTLTPDQMKDSKLIGNAELVQKMRTLRLNASHIGNPPLTERLRKELGEPLKERTSSSDSSEAENKFLDHNLSTVDEFIISGTNLCFGILQLVLSMLPPGIGKVLSIVGFKGSREDGLKRIWKSVESRNVHGCIGLLALLVFYDGPFQFTDADFDTPEVHEDGKAQPVSPTVSSKRDKLSLHRTKSAKLMHDEVDAFQGRGHPTLLHPGKKLEDSLLYARAIFPHSALWLIQEARMLTSRGRLEEALNLMDSLDRKIQMAQVEALFVFDRVMVLIFLHRYERAAEEVLRLIKINSWSPGLYTYCAGGCYLELYRMCQMGIITDKKELARAGYFRSKAKELILKAPHCHKEGKKIKQMPFDKFVIRKVAQFESAAREDKVDVIDAIGTSLIHELSYFWNGFNRMPEEQLEVAQKMLNYGISEHAKVPEYQNQSMLRNFLQSLILRRLGDISGGMKTLDKHVLRYTVTLQPDNNKEPWKLAKNSEDPWLFPSALYEKALFIWKQDGIESLDSSIQWLRMASGYSDDYELSTRVSMKTKAALDRLETL